MIFTGGHNVYSVEVEGALAAHPDVADVAGTGITLEDVRAFLRDRLTGYKIPHDVITGTIPRNPSGKMELDGPTA